MRRWLLLLLLVPWGHAQPDAEAALAPVQVVVDAVPEVLRDTLWEARFDGTPDRGQALADDMLVFIEGIDREFEVPPGSAAERYRLQAALPYAVELARLVVVMPGDAGDASTAKAACDASIESGDTHAAAETVRQGVSGVRGMQAFRAHLERMLDGPEGIDTAPIQAALVQLDGVEQDWGETLECLGILEELANLTARPDYVPIDAPWLVVRASPREMWPGGEVTVFGASSQAGIVGITSSAFDADLPLLNGTFAAPLTLRTATNIGPMLIEATAGPAYGNTTLQVIRAPSWINLDGPRRAELGQAVSLDIRVGAPIQVTGHVLVDGVQHELVDGRSRVALPDEVGVHSIEVVYPGSRVIEPSQAQWRFEVLAPGSAATQEPPAGPMSSTSGGILAPGLGGPADGLGAWLGVIVAYWWIWAAAAALLIVVVLLAQRRRRPATGPAVVPLDDGPIPSGFMAAIAALMVRLLRLGRARPGTTVREASKQFEEMQRFVPAFEVRRYGPGEGEPGTPGPLRSLWRRLGRQP